VFECLVGSRGLGRERGGLVKMTKIAGGDPLCKDGVNCQTVYLTDRGTIAVQGDAVRDINGMKVPPGEVVAEISLELYEEAVRAIRQ
jgi:hypothetical protein